MQRKHLFGLILTALFVIPASATLAGVTFEVLATFDYPGDGNSTTPFGINQRGDISGRYLDASSVTRGFIRFRNGNFSAPIVEPNDTGNFTESNDINASRTVCGDFLNLADNANHGYLVSDGIFTQFDVAGALSTFVMGINDAKDFVGGFNNEMGTEEAFVNIGGAITTFAIPEAINTFAIRINENDEVVGQYADTASLDHGFLRAADGTLTFPIDFPGPGSTVLYGINARNWIVGRYTDDLGIAHGFFLLFPDTFVEYDYPGASGTSFNGINNQGIIAGRYSDSAGLRHGFIAQVRRTPGNDAGPQRRPSRSPASNGSSRPVLPESPG